MSITITLATAARVLTQVRHDRRTVAVLLTVPSLLLALLRYIFGARIDIFDQVGLTLLGIFPFISMYLITSVAMVRERISGTLERLLSTPTHKVDLLFGYGIAFGLLAVAQASVASVVAYGLLGLRSQGSFGTVIVVATVTAVLGAATGLLTSAFARTEFQALQFAPTVILPQTLLCGLIWPREQMAVPLQWAGYALPLRYVDEAMGEVGTFPMPTAILLRDLLIIVAFIFATLLVATATLRRRTE